jgi:hypothetical protein
MSHNFPAAVTLKGRMFFWRSHLEAHKKALAGLPFDDNPQPDVLVPASQAAAEFGVCRRTIGRRVFERQSETAVVAQSARVAA